MENTEFKNKVRTALTEAGILIEDDESVFSDTKVIQNETDDCMMMVGPRQEAWIFVSSYMDEETVDKTVAEFIRAVTNRTEQDLGKYTQINQKVSIAKYAECVAKQVGGKVASGDLANVPLKDLVEKGEPVVQDAEIVESN